MRVSMVARGRERIRGAAGFSLVEILIVIGIIGVLLSASAISMRGQFDRYRLQDAADRLQAQLRSARTHAMSTLTPATVTLDTIGKRLTTEVDDDHSGTVESNEVAVVQLATSTKITMTSNADAGSFRPSGVFASTSGFWKVVMRVPGVKAQQYVYVFQGGHVQASEKPLD